MATDKFKAWDKKQNKWLSFDKDNGIGFDYSLDNNNQWVMFFDVNEENIKIVKYTGLKDSDKKEIYDGDILEIEGHVKHIVGFRKGMFCWVNVVPYEPIYIKLTQYKCRIIGNIYENPELTQNK